MLLYNNETFTEDCNKTVVLNLTYYKTTFKFDVIMFTLILNV